MGDIIDSSKMAVIPEKILLKDIETTKQKSKESYLRIIEIISYKNIQNINKICDLGDIYVLYAW